MSQPGMARRRAGSGETADARIGNGKFEIGRKPISNPKSQIGPTQDGAGRTSSI